MSRRAPNHATSALGVGYSFKPIEGQALIQRRAFFNRRNVRRHKAEESGRMGGPRRLLSAVAG